MAAQGASIYRPVEVDFVLIESIDAIFRVFRWLCLSKRMLFSNKELLSVKSRSNFVLVQYINDIHEVIIPLRIVVT